MVAEANLTFHTTHTALRNGRARSNSEQIHESSNGEYSWCKLCCYRHTRYVACLLLHPFFALVTRLTSTLGKDIYRSAHGSRTVARDAKQPLTTDTLTWLASQTKLATSVSALQVVERGLIGLDDDVRQFVPELRDLKVIVGFEGENDGIDDIHIHEDISKGGPTGHRATEISQGAPIYEDICHPLTLR